MKKRLFLSVTTILVCVMVFVGVTYALLHDDNNIEGNIVVGSVDVDADLYYLEDDIEHDVDNISINDIKPGETYTYKVKLFNRGSYDIQYRNIFTVSNDLLLLDVLKVNVSSVEDEYSLVDFKYNRGVTNWDSNLVAEQNYEYILTFTLDESIDNSYANKKIEFNLLIEAIENRFTIVNSQEDIDKLVDNEYAILGSNLSSININKNIYLDLNSNTVENLSINTNKNITVELTNGIINKLDINAINSTVYCYAFVKDAIVNTDTNSFYYFNDSDKETNITLNGGRLVLDCDTKVNVNVGSTEDESKDLEIYISKTTIVEQLSISDTVTKKVKVDNNGTINELILSDDSLLDFSGNEVDVEVSEKVAVVSDEDIQLYINEDDVVKRVAVTSFNDALLGSYTTVYLSSGYYEVNDSYTIDKDLTLISYDTTTIEVNNELIFNNNKVTIKNINFTSNVDKVITTNNCTLNIENTIFSGTEVALYINDTILTLNNVEFGSFTYPILVSNLEGSTINEEDVIYTTDLSIVYKDSSKAFVVNEYKDILETINNKVILQTNMYLSLEGALDNNDQVYLLTNTTLSNYQITNKTIYANNYELEVSNIEVSNVVIDGANIIGDELKVYGALTVTNTTFNNKVALNVYESNDVYLKNNTYLNDSFVKVNADMCDVYVKGDNENVYYYSTKLNVVSVNGTNLHKDEIVLINDEEVTKRFVYEYKYTSLEEITSLTGDVYVLEGTYTLSNTLVLQSDLNIISYGIIIESSNVFNDESLLEVDCNLTINNTEFRGSNIVVGLLLANNDNVINTTNSTFTNFTTEVLVLIEDELQVTYNGEGIVVYSYTNKVVLGNNLNDIIEIEDNVYYQVAYTNINEVINKDQTIYVTGTFNIDNILLVNNLEFIGYNAEFISDNTLFTIENCNVSFTNITFSTNSTAILYKGLSTNELTTINCLFTNNNIIEVNVNEEEAIVNSNASVIYKSNTKTVVSKDGSSYIVEINNKTYEYEATNTSVDNVLTSSEVYIVSNTYYFTERLSINSDIKFIAEVGTKFEKQIADFKGHIFFLIYNCNVEFHNIEFIDHQDSNASSKGIITKSVDGVDNSNVIINNCIFNEFKSNALTINGKSLVVTNTTFKLSSTPGTNFSGIQVGGVCNAIIDNNTFIGKTNDLENSNSGILLFEECNATITNNTFDTLTAPLTVNYLSGNVTYTFDNNTLTNTTTNLMEVKEDKTYVGNQDYYEVILEDKIVYYIVNYTTIEEALLNSSDVYVLEGVYHLNSNVNLNGNLTGIGAVVINTNSYSFNVKGDSVVTNIEFIGDYNDCFLVNGVNLKVEGCSFIQYLNVISATNSNVIVSDSILEGNLDNTGLTIKDSYLELSNCNITNFKYAVLLENVDLKNNDNSFSANTYRFIYKSYDKAVVSDSMDKFLLEVGNNTKDSFMYMTTYLSLEEALTNSEVYVLSGTYVFDSTIVINNDVNIIGNNDVIFKQSDNFESLYLITVDNKTVSLKNISFTNSNITNNCIEVIYSNLEVYNCNFSNFDIAISFDNSTSNIQQSTFTACNTALEINNNSNVVVTTSKINGIDDTIGIKVNSNSNLDISYSTFTTCNIDILCDQREDLETNVVCGIDNKYSSEKSLVIYSNSRVVVSNSNKVLEEVDSNNYTYIYFSEYNDITTAYKAMIQRKLDTIYITEGNYFLASTLVIDADVNIIGIDEVVLEWVLVEGININSGNILIDNISFKGSVLGINIISADSFVIQNSNINSMETAITIQPNVKTYSIINNVITAKKTMLIYGSSLTVENSYINNNTLNGLIYFEGVSKVNNKVYMPSIIDNNIKSSLFTSGSLSLTCYVLFHSKSNEEIFDMPNIELIKENNNFINNNGNVIDVVCKNLEDNSGYYCYY